MRYFRLALPTIIVLAVSSAHAEDGWHSLFDGKTSNGWVDAMGKPFPTHSWNIEDGCLKSVVKADGFEDIRTTETFGNFELELEWKLAKEGNSGIKYLIQRYDEWTNKEGRQARARGLEYQLVDLSSPDAKDPTRYTAALYSVLATPPGVKMSPGWRIGQFNTSKIVVKGDQVEHWLNGERVLTYNLSDPKVQAALRNLLPKGSMTPTRESAISLQNHSSEAWFRNIKVRPLP